MNKCGLFIMVGILSLTSSLVAISQEEIQESYYKSYNYEKMGDYTDAIKSLSEVYSAYPKSYTVNLRLGYLSFISGYYANAIANYDLAISALPDAIEPKLGKMLVLMTKTKYEEATTLAYQILKLDHMNYLANLRLAYILRIQEKYTLAEKINLKLLTVYPTDVTFLTEYGALQYAQSNWDKAEAIFQDVLVLDPENVDSRAFLELLKTAKLTPEVTPATQTTVTKKKTTNAPKR